MDHTTTTGGFGRIKNQKVIHAVTCLIISAILIHFLFYFACLHIHTLADGSIVIHSHVLPDRTGRPAHSNHSHTSTELVFVKAVGLVSDHALIIFISINIIAVHSLILLLDKISSSIYEEISPYIHNRAPPCEFELAYIL